LTPNRGSKHSGHQTPQKRDFTVFEDSEITMVFPGNLSKKREWWWCCFIVADRPPYGDTVPAGKLITVQF